MSLKQMIPAFSSLADEVHSYAEMTVDNWQREHSVVSGSRFLRLRDDAIQE
jgi:hypothetical protein